MNKKRWIYLIFLIMVFVIFFIKPIYRLFYLDSLSDSLSFFSDKKLLNEVKGFFKINELGTILEFLGINKSFKNFIRIGYIIITYVFGFISLKIYRSFFEQEEKCLHYEKISILKSGIIFFAIMLLLIFIFVFSVSGYAFALFFIFLTHLLIVIGKIGFGLYVGGKITKSDNIFCNLWVGFVFFDIICLVPYVGLIVRNVVIPIISLGLLSQNVYNLFFLKKFFEENRQIIEKNMFNKSEIYDIIVSNRKERNGDE